MLSLTCLKLLTISQRSGCFYFEIQELLGNSYSALGGKAMWLLQKLAESLGYRSKILYRNETVIKVSQVTTEKKMIWHRWVVIQYPGIGSSIWRYIVWSKVRDL